METELVKVLQLKYPTISYTNKLYEENKKTLLTQTLHRKTQNCFAKSKKFSPAAGYKSCFTREIIAKLLCDDNSNTDNHAKDDIPMPANLPTSHYIWYNKSVSSDLV